MSDNKKKGKNNRELNKLMKAEQKKKEKLDREKRKKMQIIKERIDIEAKAKKQMQLKKLLKSTGQNIYNINKKKIIDFMISLKDVESFDQVKNLLQEQISKYENPTIKNYTEIDITKDTNYICTYVMKNGKKCSGLRHLGKFCIKHAKKDEKVFFDQKEDSIIRSFLENSEEGIDEKGIVSKIVKELKSKGFSKTSQQVKNRWKLLNESGDESELEIEEEDEIVVPEGEGENIIKINRTNDEMIINLDIYNVFVNIINYFDKDLFDKFIIFIEYHKYTDESEKHYSDLDILYNNFLFSNEKENLVNLKKLKRTITDTSNIQFLPEITDITIYSPNIKYINPPRKKINLPTDKRIKLTDKNEISYSQSIYSNPPWIPYRVKNIYINTSDFAILYNVISSYNMQSEKMKEYKREKYAENIKNSKNIGYDIDILDKNLIIDEEGNKWYKVNKMFFKFFNLISLFRKKQEGEILTVNIENLFEDFGDETEIKLKIGFLIDDENFIIQNENIFNQEIEYFRNQNSTTQQKTRKILKEQLSKEIIEVASEKLFEELKKITNLTQGRNYSDEIVKQMAIGCENVNEFIEKMADFLVYIEPTVDNIGNKIFKKKLISGYYLPEVIPTLSPAEKLPEIFNDSTPAKFQDTVANVINNCKSIFVQDFLLVIYNRRYGKNKIEYNPITIIKCENSKKYEKFAPEEIVYYYNEETDKTYCFLIKDLLTQFRDGNSKIYTKSKFEIDDNVEVELNGKWVEAKIIHYEKYIKRYILEYKNENDEIIKIKIDREDKIRGGEGEFSEKFVENFMKLYGDMQFEEKVEQIENPQFQQISEEEVVVEEELLVPNLLELIEQDIFSITGETFEIVKKSEIIIEEQVDEQDYEEEINDPGSVIVKNKKTGLKAPKRIFEPKLFEKWVKRQKKRNEKLFKNYSPKVGGGCISSCEECGKKSGVVKTVGKKNQHMHLCLDCMENKDSKIFY